MLQALIDEEVRKDTARQRIGEFLDKKRPVDEKKGGPRAPQAQGPPFRSEGDYLKTPR